MDVGSDDFKKPTEAQQLSDSIFLENVRTRYIEPLLSDIEQSFPNYRDAPTWDKIKALLTLNEPYYGKGDSLLLHFGFVDEVGGDMPATVYAGKQLGGCYEQANELEGIRWYAPFFVDEDNHGMPGLMHTLEVFTYNEEGQALFDGLPPAYRAAVIACHIRQNMVVSKVEATRYACGIDAELQGHRYTWRGMRNQIGQTFGWQITLRDSVPPDKLLLRIAKELRESANWLTDSHHYTTLAADKTDILANRPVRSRRKSTNLLVEFVDEYLPSIGLHAGTKDCSWTRAMGLFMDRYPDAKSYGTPRNFADCYRKAKKRREDTPQNRSDTN